MKVQIERAYVEAGSAMRTLLKGLPDLDSQARYLVASVTP